MDKQKNASEFSNNISADDLLKKLKENIDSVSDDGSEVALTLENEAASFSDAVETIAEDASPVSNPDTKEDIDGSDDAVNAPDKISNKPLQIQHRYKFRRSTRIKKPEPQNTLDTDDFGLEFDGDNATGVVGLEDDLLADVPLSNSQGMSEAAKALLSNIVADMETEPDNADLTETENMVSDDQTTNDDQNPKATYDVTEEAGDTDEIDEVAAEKIEDLMRRYMSDDEQAEYLSNDTNDSEEATAAADTTDASQDGERVENALDEAPEATEEFYDEVMIDSADSVDSVDNIDSIDEHSENDNADLTKDQDQNDAYVADDAEVLETADDIASSDAIDSVNGSDDEIQSADTVSEDASEETSSLEPEDSAADVEKASDDDSDESLSNIFNEDFDETDANLMLAFGMEEELEKSIGKENVDKISENLDKQNEQLEAEGLSKEKKKKEKEPKPEAEETEYTAFNQTKEILNGFKTKYKNATYRMLAVAVVAVLLFFFENIGIFGGSLPEALDLSVYPVVHILIDLQLLLMCFLPAYHILLDGFKALVALKPNVNSILSVVASVSVIYTFVMCFISTGMDFHMYSFPVAMCVLLALVNERLNLQREVYSFNVVSSRRPKYVLDRLSLDRSDLEKEAFYNVLPENPSIFKIEKTSFVNGFFRRTREYSKNKVVINAVIPASIVIAVITFIIALFVMKSASSAFFAAYLTFMLCVPFSMLLTYSLPCCKASKDAYKDESAFVGESALDEYTTASSISFDDKDVFPAGGVKVKSVKVFGNNRIDHVIYNVASVFSALGGPLSSVLDIATMDMGKSEKVELLDISNDGIEALVDDQHMLVGKANYLRKNRFVPISDPDDDDIESTGGISIMYLVSDNEISAKIYVEYHIDPDFEYILKKMYRSGICVGIKTVDPNIDDEMLGRIIRLEKYPVRVLKCREAFDHDSSKEGIDSGIVSKRSTKALLKTFTLCDKVQHITKANIIINAFAALIGIMISAFIIWLNIASGVFSIYVFMYQLFWILPIYVTSRLFI